MVSGRMEVQWHSQTLRVNFHVGRSSIVKVFIDSLIGY